MEPGSDRYRPTTMRLLLGTVLLLALAGCGSDDARPASPPSGDGAAPEVVLVSQTAGGGAEESRATDVTDPADLASYVARFDDGLAAEVTRAAGQVEGDVVVAQVVSIGCGVPASAFVRGDVIVPRVIGKPSAECFAPVTTVGVAGLPG